MGYTIRRAKKVPSSYKSIYIPDAYYERIRELADTNDTSINNLIISMIEHCLSLEAEEGKEED